MSTGDKGQKGGRCGRSQSHEMHAECVHGRQGDLLYKACLPGKQANKNEDAAHANQGRSMPKGGHGRTAEDTAAGGPARQLHAPLTTYLRVCWRTGEEGGRCGGRESSRKRAEGGHGREAEDAAAGDSAAQPPARCGDQCRA